MTRAFTWAAVSAVGVAAVLASNGCTIISGTGTTGTGGGSTGSDTTTGSPTTGTYTTTTGPSTGTGIPTSCDAAAGDDACTACEKKSCCAELQACDGDANCAKTYGDYADCLYPSGGDWSGYTSTYCDAAAAQNSPAGAKSASALIQCLTSTCGTDAACGTPITVTWDNFAAEFTENFCAGCHFPGFSAPDGKSVPTDIPQFTDDFDWQYWPWPQDFPIGPKANPDWKAQMNYDKTAATGDAIWCGVSVQLPDECGMKFPGKFPTAERFPPPGTDPNKAQCIWNEDASCPAPSDVERNQMASWIFDKMPK